MSECKLKSNISNCTCTYEPCKRKGICCECISYHRRNDELPACYFSSADEKTYNRSVSAFIKSRIK